MNSERHGPALLAEALLSKPACLVLLPAVRYFAFLGSELSTERLGTCLRGSEPTTCTRPGSVLRHAVRSACNCRSKFSRFPCKRDQKCFQDQNAHSSYFNIWASQHSHHAKKLSELRMLAPSLLRSGLFLPATTPSSGKRPRRDRSAEQAAGASGAVSA